MSESRSWTKGPVSFNRRMASLRAEANRVPAPKADAPSPSGEPVDADAGLGRDDLLSVLGNGYPRPDNAGATSFASDALAALDEVMAPIEPEADTPSSQASDDESPASAPATPPPAVHGMVEAAAEAPGEAAPAADHAAEPPHSPAPRHDAAPAVTPTGATAPVEAPLWVAADFDADTPDSAPDDEPTFDDPAPAAPVAEPVMTPGGTEAGAASETPAPAAGPDHLSPAYTEAVAALAAMARTPAPGSPWARYSDSDTQVSDTDVSDVDVSGADVSGADVSGEGAEPVVPYTDEPGPREPDPDEMGRHDAASLEVGPQQQDEPAPVPVPAQPLAGIGVPSHSLEPVSTSAPDVRPAEAAAPIETGADEISSADGPDVPATDMPATDAPAVEVPGALDQGLGEVRPDPVEEVNAGPVDTAETTVFDAEGPYDDAAHGDEPDAQQPVGHEAEPVAATAPEAVSGDPQAAGLFEDDHDHEDPADIPIDAGDRMVRTLSEVADAVGVPQHVLRFWETRFPQIDPVRRGGGRRFYRPEDVDLVSAIHALLHRHRVSMRTTQLMLNEHGPEIIVDAHRNDTLAALLPPPEAPEPGSPVTDMVVEPEKAPDTPPTKGFTDVPLDLVAVDRPFSNGPDLTETQRVRLAEVLELLTEMKAEIAEHLYLSDRPSHRGESQGLALNDPQPSAEGEVLSAPRATSPFPMAVNRDGSDGT